MEFSLTRALSVAGKAIGRGSLQTYNHLNRKFDRIFETGWRRCYGWLGLVVGYYTFVYAPGHGIAVDAGQVNFFLTTVFGAFVARGVEKVARDRAPNNPRADVPGGGLVNPQAIA